MAPSVHYPFWLSFRTKQPALRKFIGFLFCLLFLAQRPSAQADSCGLQISLLTCSPGEELYSTFGHTAIRVKDSTRGMDYVFNYGTFEFSPQFYTEFIQGKLLYYLSVDEFANFMYQYQMESRSVVEQPLQLSCAEEQQLFSALQWNAQEENRKYLYDFLFDNCTTRARDIIAKNTKTPVQFPNILPATPPTFRDLIHTYLDLGGQYWSKLGIDILLGAKLDRRVSNLEAMFLPEHLMQGMAGARVQQQSLAPVTSPVLTMPSPLNTGSWFRPAVVFSLLLALAIGLQLKQRKGYTRGLKIFDTVLFLALGLAGILLLFMWFGTDHKVTANNYNLLWALPTHVVVAFLLYRKKGWVISYFRVVFWLTAALLVLWAFLPQEMNNALLPLIMLIFFRSWFLSKPPQRGAKSNHL
jgi:hypothetical protein